MSRRRSTRYVSPEDRKAFLALTGKWRDACIAMMTRAPINDPFYKSLGGMTEAIDNVAEAVIGRRDHFHTRKHSSPAPSWSVTEPQATAAAEPASLAGDGGDGAGRCGGE